MDSICISWYNTLNVYGQRKTNTSHMGISTRPPPILSRPRSTPSDSNQFLEAGSARQPLLCLCCAVWTHDPARKWGLIISYWPVTSNKLKSNPSRDEMRRREWGARTYSKWGHSQFTRKLKSKCRGWSVGGILHTVDPNIKYLLGSCPRQTRTGRLKFDVDKSPRA